MRIRPAATEDGRFDMTAMMDIVFQLIAFFMIVSTFIVAEKVEVALPVAANAAQADAHPGRLVLAVTPDGTVWVGAQPVALENLAPLTARWRQQHAPARVVIRADRATAYGTVRQVMKICRDSGLNDVVFASYQSDT